MTNKFTEQFSEYINFIYSSFDRVILRGYITSLFVEGSVINLLQTSKISIEELDNILPAIRIAPCFNMVFVKKSTPASRSVAYGDRTGGAIVFSIHHNKLWCYSYSDNLVSNY